MSVEEPTAFTLVQPAVAKDAKAARLKRLLAKILIPLILIASKVKTAILIATKAKFVVLIGSMLLSIAAYGWAFGWSFAVGMVLLLFCHEMGHVIQLRREGIQASAPVFIPFLGAVVRANLFEKDAAAEARSAIAGPILGSIASLVPLFVWLETGSAFWRSLAYVGFMLNLFNLIPALPLDGGRIMAALSPAIWLVGLACAVVVCIAIGDWILAILLILIGAAETLTRLKHRNDAVERAYYKVPARTRVMIGSAYLLLASLLILGVVETYAPRTF